jgi:hypothetical protein
MTVLLGTVQHCMTVVLGTVQYDGAVRTVQYDGAVRYSTALRVTYCHASICQYIEWW